MGAERTEPAASELDGIEIATTLRPDSPAELAALLADASQRGQALVVRGGGTRLDTGNPLARADAWLDTRGLSGVLELDAEEGVVHAAAGTPLADLGAAAHEAGWELPLDPPGAGTLGGALATAAPGPRFAWPRDVVLGLSVCLATGEHTRCGGRVVKNVTGYDLMKLHVGAYGSLGVIESAWLRLRPRPEATRLLRAAVRDDSFELAAARRATARAVIATEDGVLIELAGDEAAVAADEAALGACDVAAPRDLDAARAAQCEPAEVRARIDVRPSRARSLAERLRTAGARVLVHPRHALLFARLDRPERAIQTIRDSARPDGAGVLFERLPLALRRECEVFGVAAETLALHRALKERFDPARVLNPGRFAGGL